MVENGAHGLHESSPRHAAPIWEIAIKSTLKALIVIHLAVRQAQYTRGINIRTPPKSWIFSFVSCWGVGTVRSYEKGCCSGKVNTTSTQPSAKISAAIYQFSSPILANHRPYQIAP